jgi:hypothetical protein
MRGAQLFTREEFESGQDYMESLDRSAKRVPVGERGSEMITTADVPSVGSEYVPQSTAETAATDAGNVAKSALSPHEREP